MAASGQKRSFDSAHIWASQRPLSGKADTCDLFASRMTAGLLRESVLHRYAQYCNVVRGRLLIDQQYQSVNIQDLDSEVSALRSGFDNQLQLKSRTWTERIGKSSTIVLLLSRSLNSGPQLSISPR
jgi:hypothetical protein